MISSERAGVLCIVRKRPKIMREQSRAGSLVSSSAVVYIVQRSFCIYKDERDTASKFPFCPDVYSGWSLWVSDNNNGSDRTQGRPPPSFPLCDCIFTNLMVWIKYGQSSEIFLPRVYFIYIYVFPPKPTDMYTVHCVYSMQLHFAN